jgi:hypothetical protein
MTPALQIDDSPNPGHGLGRVRWTICAMLFVATSINYMDRQVIAILKPTLMQSIGMTESGYGHVMAAFMVAYAVGLLAAGRFVDKVGTRIGYMVIMALWSLSAMGHALANSVLEFGIARFSLGLPQDHRRVVPSKRTLAGHRHLQLRRQCRRHSRPRRRSLGHYPLRLARGLSRHRRLQRALDPLVVSQLPQALQPSHPHRRGIAPHLPGSRRRNGPLNAVG